MSGERRRFGYRRLHILLKREGWTVNWKKLYRSYREEGLTVRKRGGRKRAIGTRAPMAIPQGPNQHWSLDFVSDTLSDGRRFRILCVIIRHCRSDQWRDKAHLQPGVPSHRDRHFAVRRPRRPRTRPDRGTQGSSLHGGQRQRDGTDVERHLWLAGRPASRVALHRPRQTLAERLRRELQRMPEGRVSSVIGACSSSVIGFGSVVGSCFCPRSARPRARRMLAVEGEADHAKRRACVIARRSSTRHSCGLRLIPVPDGTLAKALDELAPGLRDQIMQRLPSGKGRRRATCDALRRRVCAPPRSSPFSDCSALRSSSPRLGSTSIGGSG
ncbi:Integrase, catalytic domain [Rhodobacterales bacterium HTCC2654]|uniref:Integrase, catalytic domain n=1 Tax=Maritimibacter alkaliphilus HTCC2654 TaxID=314271 RepID=A3VMW3_9RHOB|nr:Integrase, catalytic domain [Rhodobacterales bacterium HTCC2654] [Maritimibacter alkaliphilus HTCC2654]